MKIGLILGGLVGVLALVGVAGSASAITYQNSVKQEFTFNPTINVSLSSSDLTISNLSPGGTADSNIITATVSTNAGYGYYLSATTGTASGSTSLVNSADSTYSFTNLSSNAATLSAIPDDKWGYSYSTDNGATWVSGDNGSALTGYNGLPLDADDSGATGVKLLSSNTFATSGSVKFKIGARASSSQAAGTYTGTVNFYAVTNPAPVTFNEAYANAGKEKLLGYYQMQDATPVICTAVDEGQVGQVIDTRDNQVYKIAKLADGKCWMVENLNLAGGTALSTDNTDVTSEYIASYTAGDSRLSKSGNTLVLPASDTVGFITNNYSYVYNSGNKTNCGASGQRTPCYSYYSWDAATLGSGRTIDTENTDAPYSICPKGWRLPTSGGISNNEWKRGDFYKLATAYGANLESNSYENSSSTFYDNAGPNTTVPNFLLAGYYLNGSFSGGGNIGFYWSSTSYSSTSNVHNLYFSSSYVNSADYYVRNRGFSVRCLLR